MDTPIENALNGYSPELSIDLFLGDERFNVSSVGPDELSIREARRMPAGPGTLRMTLDGKVTTRAVHLPDGIDPDRDRQSYQVVPMTQAASRTPATSRA
jgi:hypothetical protein